MSIAGYCKTCFLTEAVAPPQHPVKYSVSFACTAIFERFKSQRTCENSKTWLVSVILKLLQFALRNEWVLSRPRFEIAPGLKLMSAWPGSELFWGMIGRLGKWTWKCSCWSDSTDNETVWASGGPKREKWGARSH